MHCVQAECMAFYDVLQSGELVKSDEAFLD
jgi:hypothetical protein